MYLRLSSAGFLLHKNTLTAPLSLVEHRTAKLGDIKYSFAIIRELRMFKTDEVPQQL